jgi:hypothetical protein
LMPPETILISKCFITIIATIWSFPSMGAFMKLQPSVCKGKKKGKVFPSTGLGGP